MTDWSHVYRVIVVPQLVPGCFLCCSDLPDVYDGEMHFINFLLIMCITSCWHFMHHKVRRCICYIYTDCTANSWQWWWCNYNAVTFMLANRQRSCAKMRINHFTRFVFIGLYWNVFFESQIEGLGNCHYFVDTHIAVVSVALGLQCKNMNMALVYRMVYFFTSKRFSWYWLHLPMEGWPGWVDLGGWVCLLTRSRWKVENGAKK